jgi:uncharacterized membrane protein YeaQ/YmgE (transglycosylase-associated protein family)
MISSFKLLAQSVQVSTGPDDRGMLTSVVIWLFVGLVAGFLGSKIINKRGDGILVDIVLGLVGSFVGGFLFNLLGIHSSGSIVFSILVATIGAIIVLVIYHKLSGSGRTA